MKVCKFQDPYLDGFVKKWGLNIQTLKLKLWPRPKEDGAILARNLEQICPGITTNNSVINTNSIVTKLQNWVNTGRNNLRTIRASKGITQPLPTMFSRAPSDEHQTDLGAEKSPSGRSARNASFKNHFVDTDFYENDLSFDNQEMAHEDESDFAPSKGLNRSGLASFTEKHGFNLDINTTRHKVVKDIFRMRRLDEEVLQMNPSETMRSAMSKFISWFLVRPISV